MQSELPLLSVDLEPVASRLAPPGLVRELDVKDVLALLGNGVDVVQTEPELSWEIKNLKLRLVFEFWKILTFLYIKISKTHR